MKESFRCLRCPCSPPLVFDKARSPSVVVRLRAHHGSKQSRLQNARGTGESPNPHAPCQCPRLPKENGYCPPKPNPQGRTGVLTSNAAAFQVLLNYVVEKPDRDKKKLDRQNPGQRVTSSEDQPTGHDDAIQTSHGGAQEKTKPGATRTTRDARAETQD